MRVLVLAPEFLPVYGGVGNYILEVAKNVPRNVETLIVTPRRVRLDKESVDRGLTTNEELPSNVGVEYLGSAKDTFFHNFRFQLNCKRNLKSMVARLAIDVVHSHSAMPDYFISPKELDVPIITTIHTTIEGHAKALRSSEADIGDLRASERFVLTFGPLLKILEDRYYTNSRYYLTVSEWGKRQAVAEKRLDSDRVKVVHIGVDSAKFNPSRRADAGHALPELTNMDTQKVLYLSRMATRKGIKLLSMAAPRILSKANVHFVFAGEGQFPRPDIPRDKYTHLGYVPREIPPYLYSISDVFVLPSLYENLPAAILEAMASQCAVIASNVGGIAEMIENGRNGVLIPPDNVDAIVDAVVELANDTNKRMRIGEEARRSVLDRFSWKNTAAQISEYYSKVVHDHEVAGGKHS